MFSSENNVSALLTIISTLSKSYTSFLTCLPRLDSAAIIVFSNARLHGQERTSSAVGAAVRCCPRRSSTLDAKPTLKFGAAFNSLVSYSKFLGYRPKIIKLFHEFIPQLF